jgi:inner membrane protein
MDSISQAALGAAIGVATLGRRTAIWKAALIGAVAGTLPDLDVFIDRGDPVRNMTLHRAESHSLLYLTLLSPLLAWLCAWSCTQRQHWRRWMLAIWLILITHVLLDLMTVYGTQLLIPFTDFPYAIGSMFIIDPLYTLPLLFGLIGAGIWRSRGLKINAAGLVVSTAYLAWSMLAQTYVTHQVKQEIAAAHAQVDDVLVAPTMFNTLLWRVLIRTADGYSEGFYSLVDDIPMQLQHYANGAALAADIKENWALDRVKWFSHGYYRLTEENDRLIITDLRFGQEPHYNFRFAIAKKEDGQWLEITPEAAPSGQPWGISIAPTWARLSGKTETGTVSGK